MCNESLENDDFFSEITDKKYSNFTQYSNVFSCNRSVCGMMQQRQNKYR